MTLHPTSGGITKRSIEDEATQMCMKLFVYSQALDHGHKTSPVCRDILDDSQCAMVNTPVMVKSCINIEGYTDKRCVTGLINHMNKTIGPRNAQCLCSGIVKQIQNNDITRAMLDCPKDMSQLQRTGKALTPFDVGIAVENYVTSYVRSYLDEGYAWGYKYGNIPLTWHLFYPGCKGDNQSPVNIMYYEGKTDVLSESDLNAPLAMDGYDTIAFTYNKNTGYTVKVEVNTASGSEALTGGPICKDCVYRVLQIHWHWGAVSYKGSEHRVNLKMYPLELHIVHYNTQVGMDILNDKRGLCVTGFFFEISSSDNDALTPLIDAIEQVQEVDEKVDVSSSTFDLKALIEDVAPVDGGSGTKYATYQGSLTTPGCNEVVTWIVFLTPLKISESQLAVFRSLDAADGLNMVNNFRPPQKLKGREVKFYE